VSGHGSTKIFVYFPPETSNQRLIGCRRRMTLSPLRLLASSSSINDHRPVRFLPSDSSTTQPLREANGGIRPSPHLSPPHANDASKFQHPLLLLLPPPPVRASPSPSRPPLLPGPASSSPLQATRSPPPPDAPGVPGWIWPGQQSPRGCLNHWGITDVLRVVACSIRILACVRSWPSEFD
jgi:hypothetical protein